MDDKLSFVFPATNSAKRLETELKTKPPAYWKRKGERMALSLYAFAREHVPAYAKFLKEHGVREPSRIRTMRHFKEIPLVTKTNYLRAHEYGELFPPLGLHRASTVAATSGSTGEPFFFPRSAEHDRFYERSMEVLLGTQWQVKERSTLCIIGFGLGIWIGGIFTYKNFNKLAESKLPMTLVPVGTNVDLYLRSFQKFTPHFDQVILTGYPPFVKDMLEEGRARGIEWQNYRLRILTAAEGYSEEFRNHLAQLSGADPVRDMVNIYGTVEQGTIAHETALANMIRRIAYEREDVFKALFPSALNIPTLAQYYPDHVYFEEVGGQVVATGYGSSIPLVRYTFSDLGGVIHFDEMREKLAALGIDMDGEAKKYGIESMVLPLPFVYVHARADFVLVFRGANIYPEEIRTALDNKVLGKWITGRFTAVREENERHDPVLAINVELNEGVSANDEIERAVRERVMNELVRKNSEYAYLHSLEKEKVVPRILLLPHGDESYFSREGKQKWVQK